MDAYSVYARLADKADFRTWQLLKAVTPSTLLNVGSELALSGQSDLIQTIRMSTLDNAAPAGDQIEPVNAGTKIQMGFPKRTAAASGTHGNP